MSSKVIRSLGSIVASEDDARLFKKIFTDGLFNEVSITSLGANKVHVPALYGIIQGRDFRTDQQDITVPISPSGTDGLIVVRIDLTKDAANRVTVVGYIGGRKPTVEDLSNGGNVAEMIIATYAANSVQVTNVTTGYDHAYNATNSTNYETITLEAAAWDTNLKTYRFNDKRIRYDASTGQGTLQTLSPAIGISADQLKALQKANIVDGGQGSGYLTLKAMGKVPTIDIPVRIRYFDYNSKVTG